ncbi:MAG: hypothetical protein ACYC2G_00015 [Gemmatimonadaceae bacterium]
MTWRAVVAALDDGEAFRSRVSVYLHPLAGRPLLWHVVSALLETSPPPTEVLVLHRAEVSGPPPDLPAEVRFKAVPAGRDARALRAAVTPPGLTVLVDGSAALLTSATIARLLRAAQSGVAVLSAEQEHLPGIAVAGEGPALASADDPRHPIAGSRVTATDRAELLRVVDRHALAVAGAVVRDRLVRRHESHGVTFLMPATTLIDMDVRIGADTVIYPCVVLEGATVIGSECVIGPYSRVVESTIGRGSELTGWNYVLRSQVRNQAVLEAHARRGEE